MKKLFICSLFMGATHSFGQSTKFIDVIHPPKVADTLNFYVQTLIKDSCFINTINMLCTTGTFIVTELWAAGGEPIVYHYVKMVENHTADSSMKTFYLAADISEADINKKLRETSMAIKTFTDNHSLFIALPRATRLAVLKNIFLLLSAQTDKPLPTIHSGMTKYSINKNLCNCFIEYTDTVADLLTVRTILKHTANGYDTDPEDILKIISLVFCKF